MFSGNADFVQAIIEVFGAIIALVLVVMFIVMTDRRKKSEKEIVLLLVLVGMNLLLEAIWYICDGHTSQLARVANRFANILGYIDNAMMAFAIAAYIRSIIFENGGRPKKVFLYIVRALGTLMFIIPITNVFYPWIYSFDANNVYYRMPAWFCYPTLSGLVMIVLLIMVMVQKECFTKNKRYTLYFLLLAPFIGTGLQAFNFGISFIQLGIAAGAVVAVGGYTTDWIFSEAQKSDRADKKRHFWIIEGVFLLMIFFITAALTSNVISIASVSQKESEQSSRAVAHMVSGTIGNTLGEPIDVSRTMAQGLAVGQALKKNDLRGSASEQSMTSYMKRIKSEYGFQAVFAVSDSTKEYYTQDGFRRYIGQDDQQDDSWYYELDFGARSYNLNTSADPDGDNTQTLYVNTEVLDENGNRIGVCGVGIHVDKLTERLKEYESDYEIDICLVDKDGCVKINTNQLLVDKEIVDISNLSDENGKHFTYQRNKSEANLTRYMDKLGWYLIVKDKQPDKIDAARVVAPSLLIYALGVVLTIILTLMFGTYEKRRNRDLVVTKQQAETDALTGLLNRYSMEKFIEEIRINGMPRHFAIGMFDVNELKEANDRIGHMAGDELLMGTADCLFEVFSSYGSLYRIGGDEFLVMCQCDKVKFQKLLKAFDERVKNWEGQQISRLSISSGAVSHEDFPDYTIDQLRREADMIMYQNKAEYYSKKGNDRRRNR